jgi:hypothetical protein
LFLAVQIRRIVDDSFPGWVECSFVDAAGSLHLLVEKIPVVTRARIDSKSALPQVGFVECVEIGRRSASGRVVVSIDTDAPLRISSTTGLTHFEVGAEQLTDPA